MCLQSFPPLSFLLMTPFTTRVGLQNIAAVSLMEQVWLSFHCRQNERRGGCKPRFPRPFVRQNHETSASEFAVKCTAFQTLLLLFLLMVIMDLAVHSFVRPSKTTKQERVWLSETLPLKHGLFPSAWFMLTHSFSSFFRGLSIYRSTATKLDFHATSLPFFVV